MNRVVYVLGGGCCLWAVPVRCFVWGCFMRCFIGMGYVVLFVFRVYVWDCVHRVQRVVFGVLWDFDVLCMAYVYVICRGMSVQIDVQLKHP